MARPTRRGEGGLREAEERHRKRCRSSLAVGSGSGPVGPPVLGRRHRRRRRRRLLGPATKSPTTLRLSRRSTREREVPKGSVVGGVAGSEGFMAARALRGAASAASEVGASPRRRRLVARGGGGAGAPTVSVVAGAPTERSTRPRPRPRASGSDRRRNQSPRRPRLRRRASDSARLLRRPPG